MRFLYWGLLLTGVGLMVGWVTGGGFVMLFIGWILSAVGATALERR